MVNLSSGRVSHIEATGSPGPELSASLTITANTILNPEPNMGLGFGVGLIGQHNRPGLATHILRTCQLFTDCSQAKLAVVTCRGNFLGRVTSYATRTTINAVLAPLVRLASRLHLVQPIRNPTAGVARIFRTEME